MKRIMIFNDQPDTLDMYLMILEREGYLPFPRLEATATEADIATIAPDLIIIDWTHGLEQRGIDLLISLRSLRQATQMPMIVCMNGNDARIKSYQATVHKHGAMVLGKPFEVPELLTLIEANLAS